MRIIKSINGSICRNFSGHVFAACTVAAVAPPATTTPAADLPHASGGGFSSFVNGHGLFGDV